MKYRNLGDLIIAVLNGMERKPPGLTHDEAVAWYKSQPDMVELSRLCGVYFDAQRNPPEGVIGVGAITYAEQMLQAAQK